MKEIIIYKDRKSLVVFKDDKSDDEARTFVCSNWFGDLAQKLNEKYPGYKIILCYDGEIKIL